MRIAIVDDLESDRYLLIKKIDSYMNTHKIDYNFFEFETGESILLAVSQQNFDIIFLDIYIGDLNGVDVAKKIRKMDADCKLIFLTSSEDFLRAGYSVNASHYLIKPINNEEFEEAMNNCRIQPQYETPFLDVVYGGINLHLNTAKILYVDIYDRNTVIHMTDRCINVVGSFSKITAPLLLDKRFLLCIQGVLVNMDYISGQDGSVFVLKNGQRLQIALRNKKSIIQNYLTYVFKNMNN